MPKLVEQPNVACRVAGYFWKLHDLNDAADAGDFKYITRKINGGLTGEAEREAYWEAAKALLAVPAAAKGPAPSPGPQPTMKSTPGPAPGPVPFGTIDGLELTRKAS
jgi:hypothetical protein